MSTGKKEQYYSNHRKRDSVFLKERYSALLRYSQIFFYLAFVFLWFKDNFSLFKGINISYLLFLLGFVLVSALRLVHKLKYKRIRIKLRLNKVILVLTVILLIGIMIRIPFFIHNFGQFDGDDAISALLAKHISEGKLPPVFHYGQMYLGTFNYHVYALVFKLFGYSILAALLVSACVYFAFVLLQYFFFREIFSSNLSIILCLFYCLPIGHLINLSLYVGGNYSFILFIGSLTLYLAYLIYAKDKEKLMPVLGFCMGLLTWIKPSTLPFSLTAMIIIAAKYRLNLKKYMIILIYGIIGGFPLILSEISHKFVTVVYLFSGKGSRDPIWNKIKVTLDYIISLISSENNFLNHIYLILFILGILAFFYLNLKKKKFMPQNIFLIYLFIFMFIYLLSSYSQIHIIRIRYLYPLYFVLPVLLVSSLDLLRPRLKLVFSTVLILIIAIFSNLNMTYRNYSLVRDAHLHQKKIINAVEKTEQRYWAGDFWHVNILTALSGEKIIGWPYSHEDYLPYKLEYFNHGKNNNFVFFNEPIPFAIKFKEMHTHISGVLERGFNQSMKFIHLLDRLGTEAKIENISDNAWLVYNISGQFFPQVLRAPIPQRIPELTLSDIKYSNGILSMFFKNSPISEKYSFRMHVEIPDYSSIVRGFALDKESIRFEIPFPNHNTFEIKYHLDYMGLKIPSTEKIITCSPTDLDLSKKRRRIIYLSGFGPWTEIYGKRMKICEKEVNLEINALLKENSKVRLVVYSPFEFTRPFWYGKYSQEIRIEMNGNLLMKKRLKERKNIIEVSLGEAQFKNTCNILTLKFKYHLPFKFRPIWKTAVLLDKIEVR